MMSTYFNMLQLHLPSHNLVHLLLPLSQDLRDRGQMLHGTDVKGDSATLTEALSISLLMSSNSSIFFRKHCCNLRGHRYT